MKRCPFCAAEIKLGVTECPSCGKTLGKSKNDEEKPGLTRLDTYKQKRVPAWVMFLVVAILLFGFAMMFFR